MTNQKTLELDTLPSLDDQDLLEVVGGGCNPCQSRCYCPPPPCCPPPCFEVSICATVKL
jgi:hypothetical protein